MKTKITLRLPTLLASSIAAMFSTASAATITWDANGATAAETDGAGVWLNASQWWDGAVNVNWTSGDDAVFGNAGAGGAVTLASPTTVNSLTLNSFTGTYTLGTDAQTITLNGGITKNAGAGAATLISPVTLGAAQSWTNNSAALLTVGTGAVNNGGFLLTLGGTGNTTVSSVISGAGGLTKSDAGLATLSGANTYGGVTTINGGVLAAATLANGGAASGIGNSSNAATNLVFGAPTATLRHTGAAATTDRSFTLSSGAGGGATIEASGASVLTLDNTIPIAYGTADETRILTLGGTQLGANVFAKVLADNGTGATSLVKAGAGTWAITAPNTYTGSTTINAGLLKFTSTSAMSSSGTIAVSSGAGLIVDVNGSGRFAPTGVGAGTFAGILTGTGAGGNTITYTGDVTVGIDISAAAAAVTYSAVIANATGSTNTSIYKFNGQNLTLTGANTFSGKTVLGAGSVVVSSFGNVGDASSPLGTNSTIEFLTQGNLSFNGSTVQSSNKTLNIAQGAATLRADGTGLGAITFSAAINPSSTSNKTFSLFGANTNANTISGDISNGAGGVLSVAKNLAGTWVLSGNNTYTGNTTISAGTLVYRNLLSKATTGNHNFASGTTIGLGVGGAGFFTSSDVDNAFSGTITGNLLKVSLNANTSVGIDTTEGDLAYASNIGIVTRGLAKLGNNTLTLSGTNEYSGITTVSSGILQCAKQVSLYNNTPANWTAARINVKNGGTLAFNVGGTDEFSTTSITTLLTNLAASSSGTNGMNAGSRLGFDTTNATGSSFTIADGIANTTGANGGARGLTKLGTGSLVLSNTNTYTGTTAVNGGRLLINGDQTAASGAVSVAANATLGGTGTIGGNTTIADNGKLDFNLSTAPGSHDKLDLAATRTLSFGANATLTITSSGGATTGLYTLVTAPGGIGTLPVFTVNLPVGWTATAPAISGNDLVIDITSLGGGSAYDTWKAANAPGSNPYDDTDGDGVTNAVEFVLGGTSLTNDLDKLPTVSTSGPDLTFSFKRAISSIDPKTALFIETSTDLVTWTASPSPYTVPDGAIVGPPVTVVEDTPVGFDTVTLSVPRSPDAKKFARLKVVITP